MYYSSFGILALILHFITNHGYLRRKMDRELSEAEKRYRQFLFCVTIYYASDILWGFFYGARLIPVAYIDTFVYFSAMVASVLLWTRFVVSYLQTQSRYRTFLSGAGWFINGSVIFHLIVNFFSPVIFYFDENLEYVPGRGRYILLVMQFLLFLGTFIYTLIMTVKTQGMEKNHYKAVSVSGFVMTVFIVLQTLYPLLPFYAIGLLIGTSMVHIFVAEDIRINHAIELEKMKKRAEREHRVAMKTREKRITFGEIAEGLAYGYDVIYYVDLTDGSYTAYSANEIYGNLEVQEVGEDFFAESRKNTAVAIHPDDRARIRMIMNKKYLLTALENRRQLNAEYRLLIDGDAQYARLIIRKTRDSGHLIIAVENVDAEVRREKAHQEALDIEKKMARQDVLTGIKNKTAYAELEQETQDRIDKKPEDLSFAIVVCDLNDLKQVNDTEGHKAGDELLRASVQMICGIFVHSPVFRIGGDEFAIVLQGGDYQAREELLGKLRIKSIENKIRGDFSRPVLATGISIFRPETDRKVSDVFERADARMYKDKKDLKAM